MTTIAKPKHALLTGDEYRESLRDGRRVLYQGEPIDVLTHPITRPGIDWIASLYDAQHDPDLAEVLTFEREDGMRLSSVWLVPRTPEDLERKRLCSEWMAWQTLATMGRTPDMLPWSPIGQMAYFTQFEQLDPDNSRRLHAFFAEASEGNRHLAGVLVEPQGTRARAAKAGEQRSAVMQVVKEDVDGIVIKGAKAVATYGPQPHDLIVGSIYYPHLRPEEAFWCAVPVGSLGLSFVCRETVSDPGRTAFDHPVTSRGEEVDAFAVFDEVHVPWERVWSYKVPELCSPMLYGVTGAGEQWQLLIHLAVKAEILAGLAQLVIDALEVSSIPAVQDQAGKVFQYTQNLRNGVMAAQHLAERTPSGILLPNNAAVTAARAYALEEYPRIVHMVQELCGQGLVMRFSANDFADPQLAPLLTQYLDTDSTSARDKNLLMNAAWDLTTSAAAGRTALFENVNGLPAAFLRLKLFGVYDRAGHAARLSSLVGLDDGAR
jgi:4-hydroxyphenylacetate 3-monooxygenase